MRNKVLVFYGLSFIPAPKSVGDSCGSQSGSHINVLSSSSEVQAVIIMPTGIGQISCPRCGRELEDKRNLCTGCGLLVRKSGDQLVPSYRPVELAVQDFAVPGDLSGCQVIESVPFLPSVIEWWTTNWSTPQTRAHLLGHGVRVTEGQLPQIHDIFQAGARRLEVKCPELFIRQDPTYNAWTVGTNDCAIVVLHSSLLNDLQPEELSFVLSHELGHVKCRHVTYSSLAHSLTNVVAGVGFGLDIPFSHVLTAPLRAAIANWERQAEFTADRAGLIGSANVRGSVSALAMLALGSRKFLPVLNFPEYLSQDCDLQGFCKWVEGLNHPPTVERARSLIQFAASDTGLAILRHLEKRGLLNQATPGQKQLPASTNPRGSECQPRASFCKKCGFELEPGRNDCIICSAMN